jgi:hypothetical protein
MPALILAAAASAGLFAAGQSRRSPGLLIFACCALPLAAALLAIVSPGYVARNAPDGQRYVEQITILRSSGLGELVNGHVASGKELFPILLVPLSFLFKPTNGLVAVVNATLASTASLVIEPRWHPNQHLARRAVRYYPFFSPSLWFFVLLPLREGAVVFFLALWAREIGERYGVVSRAAALVALVFLRPVVAVCAAISLVIVEVRSRRLVHRPAMAVGGLALILVLVAVPPIRTQILGVTPAGIAADRNYNASISTSGLPPADGSSWLGLASGLPRDLANVWLRPNPLLDRSAFVLATVDTIGLLYLVRAAARTRRAAIRSGEPGAEIALKRATNALWFSMLMAVSYALTVGDLGQLLRGRMAVLFVLWHSQLYEKEPCHHASPAPVPTNRLRRDQRREIPGLSPIGVRPRGDDPRPGRPALHRAQT